MNILILNWRDPKNPLSGGAETLTMEHAKGWVKYGHRVTWFTSTFSGANKKEIIDGVEFVRRGNSIGVYLLAPFFVISNRSKFDIIVDEVHCIPFFTPLYTKKPVIVFIHEVAGEIWDIMFTFPINIIGKILENIYFKIYRKYDFWTVSESTAAELRQRGISEEKISIIKSVAEINQKPDVKKEKNPTYIFISRLVKMKGIEDVIIAFFLIFQMQPLAILWIIGTGDGKYINYLKNIVKLKGLAGHVKFWGYLPDKEKLCLLSKAHILLHASVKEGWGLVVMEAGIIGTPSVVYNVPGLRDSVIDGKTGIVVKKNLPEELAREAVSLYNDRSMYQSMSEAGINLYGKQTWKKSSDLSLSLINKYNNEKSNIQS